MTTSILPLDEEEEKKKKIKTKLDLHKSKVLEAGESKFYFDQVEKVGPQFVEQWEGDIIKKDKRRHDEILNAFEMKHRFQIYNTMLAEYGQRLLRRLEWPAKWRFDVIPTIYKVVLRIYGRQYKGQDGVLFVLKSPEGKIFIRGIKSCRISQIDIHAIETLAEQAENTLDHWKGILLDKVTGEKKTKDGIIIPS